MQRCFILMKYMDRIYELQYETKYNFALWIVGLGALCMLSNL